MDVTKGGIPITKGRLFRLTRKVTGEDEDGSPSVVYGTVDDLIVATGKHINENAFEVMTMDVPMQPDIKFYTPFMVTLDDVTSVEDDISEKACDQAIKLLKHYDEYRAKYEKNIYSELEGEMSGSIDQSTKGQILDFLDRMVELKGGYYAFGYFEEEN